jgi:hypothetical protein
MLVASPAPRTPEVQVNVNPLRVAAATLAVLLAAPAAVRAESGPIQDNSFLIEEAYNQEPGVIQHISTFARSRSGAWAYAFTEEWPVLGQTHQASVTFTALRPEDLKAGVGDVALNYRLQAIGSGETRVAFSPRLSMLLPAGNAEKGIGSGGVGVQVNLPLSVVLLDDRLVTHVNLGGTYTPATFVAPGEDAASTQLAAGQSLIWLAHSNFNVMVEALYTNTALALPGGTQRTDTFTINPGVRGAINFASGLQVVPGISVPLGVGPSSGERAIFFYLSFEHPFRLAGPTQGT